MEGEDEESDNPRAFGRARRVEKDRHPLRRGFHEFSDRLCADPDPFFPGHRFRAATIDGFLEGYGVEDSGSSPGTWSTPWTDTGSTIIIT